MPRQFDVFRNPVRVNQRIYPYLVLLQSEVSQSGGELIIAPLALRNASSTKAARTLVETHLDGDLYVVLVPLLTAIAAVSLGRPIGTIEQSRDLILTALDYLFFGI
jgi:toxin CcdB